MNNKTIKIIKPPRELDANKLIREEIYKRNMICPFCGETREGSLVNNLVMQGESYGVCHTGICRNWYGKHDEEALGFKYSVMDRYTRTGEIDDEEVKEKIDKRVMNSRFKRKEIPYFDSELKRYVD